MSGRGCLCPVGGGGAGVVKGGKLFLVPTSHAGLYMIGVREGGGLHQESAQIASVLCRALEHMQHSAQYHHGPIVTERNLRRVSKSTKPISCPNPQDRRRRKRRNARPGFRKLTRSSLWAPMAKRPCTRRRCFEASTARTEIPCFSFSLAMVGSTASSLEGAPCPTEGRNEASRKRPPSRMVRRSNAAIAAQSLC